MTDAWREGNCIFCNAKIEFFTQNNQEYNVVKCPCCGNYKYQTYPEKIGQDIKDQVAAYMYYSSAVEHHNDSNFYNFLGSEDYYQELYADNAHIHFASLSEIISFYPRSFSERITRILLGIAEKSLCFGDIVKLSDEQFFSAFFIRRYDDKGAKLDTNNVNYQIEQIIKYLTDNSYIDIKLGNPTKISLMPEGWKRVDTLQRNDYNNKNVFVSMAFNDNTKNTREALRAGIIDAGYSAEFIDEIIHNQQIVPEMFCLIRESRFLILEISDPNYGAYYEAGYALGLGKEVIVCCSSEVFNKQYESEEEKKFARYLKPHFDIVQKQILVWNDFDDLRKKIAEWIKALF